jgi:succinate dehydrogenase / fumarate reductase cytochrome b subunit
MSALAAYWRSAVGKKMVMAVTGLILFAYVFVHMLGNLQLYAGDGGKAINEYAAFLHSTRAAPLLWAARIVLILCVVLHVWAAIVLTIQAWGARPVRYAKRVYREVGYAARTMVWSGPIIGAFIVYHILHLTCGSAGLPFQELRAYENVVNGFTLWYVSAFYIVAVLMLMLHFNHGLWSWFQTLGWSHPAQDRARRCVANLLTAIVVIGDLSFPIAVLAGLIKIPGGVA